MNELGFPLLSLMLWLPTIGALVIMFSPRGRTSVQLAISLVASTASFVVALVVYFLFDRTTPAFQFGEVVPWIPSWGINYSIAIDGISLALVLLATFITPIAIISTWDSVHKFFRSFQMLMLLLESGMLGVFIARDLFLFYIFFEFTLIPMALLIGIWGSEKRVAAAVKFFLYTFAGSILMLLSMIALYIFHGQQTGAYTADYETILASLRAGRLQFDPLTEALIFAGFFLAFAVKTPLWPFHTWLPIAHSEAPTAGSVDLAAVLLKVGGYGMIRFNLGLFPETSAWMAPAIAVLAVIGIVYGAIVSFAQTDIKRLVAYSSVSHMGFVVLGIFALNQIGITGALATMVNHGLTSSALFLIVGMIYERRHTRRMAAYGGLWKVMPIYTGLTLVMVLSTLGLPGLNGFVGEYTVMQGAWLSETLGWRYIVPSVIGVILAAAYLLRMFRITFMGDIVHPENQSLTDITRHEVFQLALIAVPVVVIGFYPNLLFENMTVSADQIAQALNQVAAGAR